MSQKDSSGPWVVGVFQKDGTRIATLSGAGRNRGTWDSQHSRSAAYRIAREMNALGDGATYKAEPAY
jgi:hypothetical protein